MAKTLALLMAVLTTILTGCYVPLANTFRESQAFIGQPVQSMFDKNGAVSGTPSPGGATIYKYTAAGLPPCEVSYYVRDKIIVGLKAEGGFAQTCAGTAGNVK